MSFIVMAAALFAGAVLKDIAPTWVAMGHAEVPAILSIVIYYALNRTTGLMLAAAAAGGILCDSLGGLPPAASIFSFCVIGALVSNYREFVFSGRWPTHMFFGAASSAAYTIILYGWLLLAEPAFREAAPSWLAAKVLGAAILGAVVTPLVFRIMQALDTTMGNTMAAETA